MTGKSQDRFYEMAADSHKERNPEQDHYIGIDVGTGSARACLVDYQGNIIGSASENTALWQPEQGFYVSAGPIGLLSCNGDGRLRFGSVGETDSHG